MRNRTCYSVYYTEEIGNYITSKFMKDYYSIINTPVFPVRDLKFNYKRLLKSLYDN